MVVAGLDMGAESLLMLGEAGGAVALIGGALALGIRHGIDWDHIAAITDITSSSAAAPGEDEVGLLNEPAVMFTDERHHRIAGSPELATAAVGAGGRSLARRSAALVPAGIHRYFEAQRQPFWLGTLYALGHGAVVTVLGLLAILASEVLPDWIDPVMGRAVGVTLLVLAAYLYYSLYRYFRGGRFQLRSRWMLVFAGARHAYRTLGAKLRGRTHHEHVREAQQYGPRAAFTVGMIHGVGAETGTQALLIAAAVGAASKTAGVVALLAFVVGVLIANSFITIATTAGFVSTQKRQWVYAGAGLVAAVFSTVLGVIFLLGADASLPDLGRLLG